MPDAETLTAAGHDVRRMPMGTDCACHRHTEWVPIEAHHIWPKGMGGPDTAANKVKVCANAHYAIHEYLRQLMLHDGEVPAEVGQHFSFKIKKFAAQGWNQAGKPTHGTNTELPGHVPGQMELPSLDDD